MGERKDIEKYAWTEKRIQTFVECGNLNKEQEDVLRCRLKEYTMTQLCRECNMSPSKANRVLKRVKEIYDAVQADYPELGFRPRRYSEKEKYMDEN